MQHILNVIFKIQKGEGLTVIKFVLLFMLLQAGLAIGITTSDSLFLLNVGADKLPVIYVLMLFVMVLGYVPLFSYFTTRLGLNRVFELIIGFLFFGGIAFYLLLHFLSGSIFHHFILYIAKIYAALWFIGLYSLTWNFAYNYFDILDGKRLFSIFTAGSAFGAIIGGFLINILTRFLEVSHRFLVWSFLAMLAFPV